MTSPVYWHPFFYSAFMRLTYGLEYYQRFDSIAEFIPERSTVTELCAGFGELYLQKLAHKNVIYNGYDINQTFIRFGKKNGVPMSYLDISSSPVPQAEIIILQASLYQFFDNCEDIIERMIEAASLRVIISEPIKNLSSSDNPLIAWTARHLANPGSGHKTSRFDSPSFKRIVNKYADLIEHISNTGSREMLCVLKVKDNR